MCVTIVLFIFWSVFSYRNKRQIWTDQFFFCQLFRHFKRFSCNCWQTLILDWNNNRSVIRYLVISPNNLIRVYISQTDFSFCFFFKLHFFFCTSSYVCLVFYAPNFEEVEGAYWFGPVRPSVRLSVRNTFWKLRNSRTPYARILKFYIWHIHEK